MTAAAMLILVILPVISAAWDKGPFSDTVHHCKTSADQGNATAQFIYGVLLTKGDGVPRNLSEAARYYKMSADQGNAEAQFHYGTCLANGEGVSRNLFERGCSLL